MLLVSTAYLPPVSYMAVLVQKRTAALDVYEQFVKQSYRNRCVIYGANGLQSLTVPVLRSDWRRPIKEMRISYAEQWADNHWRALQAAYNNSPFFAVLGDDIKTVYNSKPTWLVDLNQRLLNVVLDWLQDTEITLTPTTAYVQEAPLDLRNRISPKRETCLEKPVHYSQHFANKHGFKADLSVIDLIFNEGRAAWDYLHTAALNLYDTSI